MKQSAQEPGFRNNLRSSCFGHFRHVRQRIDHIICACNAFVKAAPFVFNVVIGWLVAVGLEGLVVGVLRAMRVQNLLERAKLKNIIDRLGVPLDISVIVGWLIKWFFIIVFLITAADILQWTSVTLFLRTILFYIPNVIIAVFILFSGVVIAHAVSVVILHTITASGVAPAQPLATLAKWSIVVFSILAALTQLGIATELIQIVFTGFVFMVSLAGGLAFGLGGRDEAARIVERIRKSFI